MKSEVRPNCLPDLLIGDADSEQKMLAWFEKIYQAAMSEETSQSSARTNYDFLSGTNIA